MSETADLSGASVFWNARVDVPLYRKMKLAGNFQQLEMNLNSDQFWTCIFLFERLAGVPISRTGLNDAEHWLAFSEMVAAIPDVIRVLNYGFGYLGITLETEIDRSNVCLSDFHEWLARQPDNFGNRFIRAFAILILEVLITGNYLAAGKADQLFRLFQIFAVQRGESTAQQEVEESAVFISYKHAPYFVLAKQLHDALTREDIACWLDREKLGLREGDWIDPRLLKHKLKSALRSALCTVFFESYYSAAVEPNFRGEHTLFNWQEFEQRFANNLLVVHPREGTIDEGSSRYSTSFTGVDNLAELIIEKLPNYTRHPPTERTIFKREKPLKVCIKILREMAKEYFGREIDISPRAALILLAPVATKSPNESVYSDDLLINLIRYSPYCAIEMIKGGLDLLSLMRVGVELRRSDWTEPINSYLFSDFLGGHGDQVEVVSEIQSTGYLDECHVFTGLLQFSCVGRTKVEELLIRTFNLMEGNPPEGSVGNKLHRLKSQAIDSLKQNPCSFIDQQWALHFEKDRLRLRPFAYCGSFRIADLPRNTAAFVRLHAAQVNSFFLRQCFKEFEDLLGANPTRTDVETFIAGSDELQAAMSVSSPIYRADLLEMVTKDRTPNHFFLEPIPRRNGDLSNGTESRGFAASLINALAMIRDEPSSLPHTRLDQNPFDFNCQRSAIIIGNPIEARPESEIPLIDFHCKVLAPLWEYQQVRNLEYDDI